jgi:hypothetical protein
MAVASDADVAQQPFFLGLQDRFKRTAGGQRFAKGFSVGDGVQLIEIDVIGAQSL